MNVYFGPYLRIPACLREVSVTVQACSADCEGALARTARGQSILESTRFCPDCGSPTAPRTRTKSEPGLAQPWHIEDIPGHRFEDLMASAWPEARRRPYSVWTPNQGKYGVYLGESDRSDLPLPDEAARAAQTERFLAAHRVFMDAAAAQLGVTPEVCYGLVVRD